MLNLSALPQAAENWRSSALRGGALQNLMAEHLMGPTKADGACMKVDAQAGLAGVRIGSLAIEAPFQVRLA